MFFIGYMLPISDIEYCLTNSNFGDSSDWWILFGLLNFSGLLGKVNFLIFPRIHLCLSM